MDLVKDSLIKATGLTVIILGIGVLIGLQLDDTRTGFINEQLEESNLRSETFLVTQDYLEDSSSNYCEVAESQIPQLAEKNAQIGNDLQSFSGQSLSNGDRYDTLKERYYVNQLKLYNMLSGYKNKCGKENLDLIFYFFDDSIESQRQGSVLTEYRKKVDNTTYVFSYNLETDQKSEVLEILKADYNVSDGPAIVINGDNVFKRYVSLKELRQVLDG